MAILAYPTYLQPFTSEDIVGFNIQNGTGSSQSARYISWGQAFKQGDVADTDSLIATIDSIADIPVQMDIKTKYSDNSVRFAVITVESPALTANEVVNGMLSKGGSSGSPVNLATALASYECSVTFTGGISTTVDVKDLLDAAISGATATYWLQGQNATQARVYIPVTSSFQLVADITAYADGTFLTDLQFRNDYSMQVSGGTVNYTAQISIDSSTVFTSSSLTHYQYEVWRRVFFEGGAPTDDIFNVQRDIAYYIRAGALPNYDLITGIDDISVDSFPNTNITPLSNPGYEKNMPGTGGRDDIGLMPAWHARWLKCQAASAARHAIAMGNGAGSIPWHHFNPSTKEHITLTTYPQLWIDDANRGVVDLTQSVLDTSWTLDTAHAPAVAFIPYVFTGQRFFLDEVNAQASRQVLATWSSPRQNGLGIVFHPDAYQLRDQAWTFRSMLEAYWSNPDGSSNKSYWSGIISNNYDELLDNLIPDYNANYGETAGFFTGDYNAGTTATVITMWQNDFTVSVLAAAAKRGDTQAAAVLEWAQNFQVGRFNHPSGLGWAAAVAYNFTVSTVGGTPYDTWAELAAVNGTSDSLPTDGGYWVPLGLQTLAGIYNVNGNTTAKTLYDAVKAENALGTGDSYYQTEYPQYHIVPTTETEEELSMVAGPFTFYNAVAESIADGTLDLDTHTFKLQLHLSTYTPDGAHVNITDLTNEHANGNGYTTGGITLSSVTWSQTGGVSTFDSADVVWTASGGSIVARWAVLIDTSVSPNKLIGYMLLDNAPANVTATNGNTFTVSPHSTQGWFQLTVNS